MTDRDDADDDGRFVPFRFDTFNGVTRMRDPDRRDGLNFAFTLVPDTTPGSIIISDFLVGGAEHELTLPQDVVVALINAARAIAYDYRRRMTPPRDRPTDYRRRAGRAWRPCLACSSTGWIVLRKEWLVCPDCERHEVAA